MLTPERKAELAALLDAGPDFERDGVVRWRGVEPPQLIPTRWNIASAGRTQATLSRRLGLRHIPPGCEAFSADTC